VLHRKFLRSAGGGPRSLGSGRRGRRSADAGCPLPRLRSRPARKDSAASRAHRSLDVSSTGPNIRLTSRPRTVVELPARARPAAIEPHRRLLPKHALASPDHTMGKPRKVGSGDAGTATCRYRARARRSRPLVHRTSYPPPSRCMPSIFRVWPRADKSPPRVHAGSAAGYLRSTRLRRRRRRRHRRPCRVRPVPASREDYRSTPFELSASGRNRTTRAREWTSLNGWSSPSRAGV
jgi:hypothetical protein